MFLTKRPLCKGINDLSVLNLSSIFKVQKDRLKINTCNSSSLVTSLLSIVGIITSGASHKILIALSKPSLIP